MGQTVSFRSPRYIIFVAGLYCVNGVVPYAKRGPHTQYAPIMENLSAITEGGARPEPVLVGPMVPDLCIGS